MNQQIQKSQKKVQLNTTYDPLVEFTVKRCVMATDL